MTSYKGVTYFTYGGFSLWEGRGVFNFHMSWDNPLSYINQETREVWERKQFFIYICIRGHSRHMFIPLTFWLKNKDKLRIVEERMENELEVFKALNGYGWRA